MKENFAQALKLVLADEGSLVNNPHDRGGLTNKGITQATYDAWRELHGRTSRSVRAIEHAEVEAIYREQFANKILFDKLPLGLDYALFDFAVNSGVSRAVRFLQRILKVRADGSLGARTLAALTALAEDELGEAKIGELIIALCDERLRFLKRLKSWKHFGRGWEKRVTRVKIMRASCFLAEVPEKSKPPRNRTARRLASVNKNCRQR